MGTFIRRATCDARTGAAARGRQEAIADRLVVTRTRRAFGVVLIGADRERAVRQTLDRAVVEIPRAHVEVAAAGDGALVDLELMVLAGDDDAAAAHVPHRMVRAVMPEWQPRRRRSDGAPDQLMTETDAEDRHRTRGTALRHRVEEQRDV